MAYNLVEEQSCVVSPRILHLQCPSAFLSWPVIQPALCCFQLLSAGAHSAPDRRAHHTEASKLSVLWPLPRQAGDKSWCIKTNSVGLRRRNSKSRVDRMDGFRFFEDMRETVE